MIVDIFVMSNILLYVIFDNYSCRFSVIFSQCSMEIILDYNEKCFIKNFIGGQLSLLSPKHSWIQKNCTVFLSQNYFWAHGNHHIPKPLGTIHFCVDVAYSYRDTMSSANISPCNVGPHRFQMFAQTKEFGSHQFKSTPYIPSWSAFCFTWHLIIWKT